MQNEIFNYKNKPIHLKKTNKINLPMKWKICTWWLVWWMRCSVRIWRDVWWKSVRRMSVRRMSMHRNLRWSMHRVWWCMNVDRCKCRWCHCRWCQCRWCQRRCRILPPLMHHTQFSSYYIVDLLKEKNILDIIKTHAHTLTFRQWSFTWSYSISYV